MAQRLTDAVRQVRVGEGDDGLLALVLDVDDALERMLGLGLGLGIAHQMQDFIAVFDEERAAQRQ